jgi:hypothetical protein
VAYFLQAFSSLFGRRAFWITFRTRRESVDTFESTRAIIYEAIRTLAPAGFSDEEIVNLIAMRKAYDDGEYAEITEQLKHMLFVRYLFQNGRLQS